jgi:hypothetical protein
LTWAGVKPGLFYCRKTLFRPKTFRANSRNLNPAGNMREFRSELGGAAGKVGKRHVVHSAPPQPAIKKAPPIDQAVRREA